MANTFSKYVLIMGISCLLPPAIAATPSVNRQLEAKHSQLDDAQEDVQKLTEQIEAKEKENKQLELNIKRFTLDVKRLSLDTAPNDATQKALNTAQFEVKRAQFTLDKNNKALKQLLEDRDKARTRKRSVGLQIDQLKDNTSGNMAGNQRTSSSQTQQADMAARQAADKQRQLLAEQQKQQQIAAEKARQDKAAAASLAAQQAADKQRQLLAEQQKQQQIAAEKQRQLLAEQQKQQQIADEKARQDKAAAALAAQQAADKQHQLLAEQQKQQKQQQIAAEKARQEQLAAAKAKEEEQQRFAEEDRLNALDAAKELADKKSSFETRAINDDESEPTIALPAAKPLSDFEKLQLLTQLSDEQEEKERKYKELNQTVAKNEIKKKSSESAPVAELTQQQTVQKQFIESSKALPPAESALTLAMARSLDAASEQPAWGTNPDLVVANPVGSYPKRVGKMKYLGNNQYMMELRVAKGQQQFNLGNYHFIKNIPDHFDGIRCLLLVDARNKEKPTFQLVIAGG